MKIYDMSKIPYHIQRLIDSRNDAIKHLAKIIKKIESPLTSKNELKKLNDEALSIRKHYSFCNSIVYAKARSEGLMDYDDNYRESPYKNDRMCSWRKY